jgi:hypothetical protein
MKLGFVKSLTKSLLISLHIFLSPPLNIPLDSSSLHTPKSHIICDQSIASNNIYTTISIEASHYFPSISARPIRYVQLPSLYDLDDGSYRDKENQFTKRNTNHDSRFHKLRYESLKIDIPYDRFCELEKRLATIVSMYVTDERSTWFMTTHPIFMYTDGLPRYLLQKENRKILYISKSVEIGYTQMVLWTDQNSSDI